MQSLTHSPLSLNSRSPTTSTQSGKAKKTKPSFEPPDTTFADVAGVDVVKAELQVRHATSGLALPCRLGACSPCHVLAVPRAPGL